jgi:hypothetical protein
VVYWEAVVTQGRRPVAVSWRKDSAADSSFLSIVPYKDRRRTVMALEIWVKAMSLVSLT